MRGNPYELVPEFSETLSWYTTLTQCYVAQRYRRTSVFDRRTFPVLRSTYSWRVTNYVGKPSAAGQPIRPTQPFILSGRQMSSRLQLDVRNLSLGRHHLVNAYEVKAVLLQVTLCDPYLSALSVLQIWALYEYAYLYLYLTHSLTLTAALDQLRVVASSTSNDPGPRSRQHQQIGRCSQIPHKYSQSSLPV